MYEVAEEARGMTLRAAEAMVFEDETPYRILRDLCRSAGYEMQIDDEARTISVVDTGG